MLDLSDCVFTGPALPEAFIRSGLTEQLGRMGLLANTQGKAFEQHWHRLRRQLGLVGRSGGPQRVCNHIIVPLARQLGFAPPQRQDAICTREGPEDGGWLMRAVDGTMLRGWSLAVGEDHDASSRRGRAYRFSPLRSAQRVMLAQRERIGLLTDGDELRLLLCDPIRQDSEIRIPIGGDGGWRARLFVPDSYRLMLALASPKGIAALPMLLDAARLTQSRVTKELRVQARAAVEGFLQAVLDHPANASDRSLSNCAETLWSEGLCLVYRLLFILKLEGSTERARGFSFAATDLWRTALSPNQALGPLVRRHLDHGHDTGRMLEDGLRMVFGVFRDGLTCNELSVTPLGGALFGAAATPLLDRLPWGERAVAVLLDRLLWTMPTGRTRERVHYGALEIEELGRVYEALLELEPGITTVTMERLRRGKLEVVLPVEQRKSRRDKEATSVTWVEDVPPGRFFLRAGLGRKTTGSYYTPHAFVRFLVRETLGPQVAQRSPDGDPNPSAILALKVVDPATGSGHFLVEACRYLGGQLYAACRMCDELAAAETNAARAVMLRRRVDQLPDPDGLLLAYLPSRASEGGASGISHARGMAICRRMVAVHCLYGVDSNRLAIELAKLSLWLESYSEGLPLTFLDHRLLHADSLTGTFLPSLTTLPIAGEPLDTPLARGVGERLGAAWHAALREVRALQASVGSDTANLLAKAAAKQRLDAALRPLRLLAQAWSGAVMLGTREMDDEWLALARAVAVTGAWPATMTQGQQAMAEAGERAMPWELAFPEVFAAGGFNAVLGNPPWDMVQPSAAEFFAGYDLGVLDAGGRRQSHGIAARLLRDVGVAAAFREYQEGFVRQHRLVRRLYQHQRFGAGGTVMGGKLDLYRLFAERAVRLAAREGAIGMVLPSAFHANEGATAIRQLYLQATRIDWCLSFENRKKLFDIHGRLKFALLVARRPGPTQSIRCAFYLNEFAQLDQLDDVLQYDLKFISSSGGPHQTLLELRTADDLDLALSLFTKGQRLEDWIKSLGVVLSRELHMTDDAGRFELINDRLRRRAGQRLWLHEGKTIHQFTDRCETKPRYAVDTRRLMGKQQTLRAAQYYRAACREIARATDERTAIAAMLPPGVICGHTISVERRPGQRPNAMAMIVVAVMNSFPFDWLLRQKAAIHASLYILAELPIPRLAAEAESFLTHGCLRLCCNHAGFAGLWLEQLGAPAPCEAWPAMATADERWCLRASMDAVVAHAYELSRTQYQRVLGSFSHRSFSNAPSLCLAAFDALAEEGLTVFCRARDPYAEIPVVRTIAQPVVELSGAERHLLPARLIVQTRQTTP